MKNEEKIIHFLNKKVFNPVLDSNRKDVGKLKSGCSLVKNRMSRLPAKSMVRYFWNSILTGDNSLLSIGMEEKGFARFEDVMVEFRDNFNHLLENKKVT